MAVSKIGGVLGKASLGAAVLMDTKGVYNYYRNPDSSNKVSPAKAGLNTSMGVVGVVGGTVGATVSTIYFGVDAFYPGGWEAAMEMNNSLMEQNQNIVTGFNLYRDY
ncbi:hypothetical protein AOB46_22675 [Chryseobacterium indologenes]|uniref:Uncharacterized protein n=2 Tax=Chryseobacterium indologenes TaxID=253 RepID=A0A0N0ITQ8_CHRID|nr:hypothetical protein AOB46_22675 [Chryseobacterium indologenes]